MGKTSLSLAVIAILCAFLYNKFPQVRETWHELTPAFLSPDNLFQDPRKNFDVDNEGEQVGSTDDKDPNNRKKDESTDKLKYDDNDSVEDVPQNKRPREVPIQLAIIDMSKYDTDFQELSHQIGKAMKDVGFAYLTNVSGFEPNKLLTATKWFFDLPMDVKYGSAKQIFKTGNPNHYRGYFPLIPGGTSFKEAFETGEFFGNPLTDQFDRKIGESMKMREILTEGNVWPKIDCQDDPKEECIGLKANADRFRDVIESHYWTYSNTSRKALSLIANHLGLDRDHFKNMFHPGQLSTFRLLHYPDRTQDDRIPPEAFVEHFDESVLVTTSEHFDTSMLTLLATFDYPGLQLDLKHDGHWQDVPPLKDGLVMNVGQMLAYFVGAENVKATYHRVLDLGYSRYSVPFFYEASFDTDVSRSIHGTPIPGMPPGTKYGWWMTNRTSMFAEYATTDWGIPD